MPKAVALVATALAGGLGLSLLLPPALPVDPAAAAGFAPYNAELQLAASRQVAIEQAGGYRAASARLALRALDAMPYNQGALAVASEMGGLPDRTQAINIAAALGWRDPLANARLVQLALSENSVTVAAQRIDALGRTQGGAFAAAGADRLMAMEGGPQALAERAAYRSGGRWWITYLRLPPVDQASQRGRLAFARSIDRNDGTWLRWIVAAMTGSLQGPSAQSDGYALWRETVADPSAFGPVLYDERLEMFGRHTAPLGGEWRRHANAPFAAERTGGGLELGRLRQAGGTVLSQMFRAGPGSYRLEVEGEAQTSALRWSIACAGGRNVFSTSELVGAWSFALPRDCSQPILLLAADGKGARGGAARLERVAVEPVS
ncbi:hypothetical protein [Erythrobacter litoralis]|uniref:Uncharacterized protein n=1 Tax=Erythrobacter litoralis (strain HTCC2594) TaxID=314225 RepID=Q2N709_ERYLH|nr:hypothetical protein [Erythrobacter litoralis]ABC64532.1 hypothetical protein ELI_12200 [Erythrobacter litoralis HTCC2594]